MQNVGYDKIITNKQKVKITDNSGNKFDIQHPEVKDVESAKTFLMDNHPFFCCEEDFENVQFEMVEE
jgi:hypothetical protein